MNLELYNKVALESSRRLTSAYSTSFSIAIKLLGSGIRDGIYSIYGFVRLADEIVDTFHDFNKEMLLDNFEREVNSALQNGISLNPVLHSFQHTVRKYAIDHGLIDAFLKSMRQDLHKSTYNREEYQNYIYGSADVVGLMCLKIFVDGNEKEFERLKTSAMRLGSAFQKVNFLRDIRNDYENLARTYFPDVDMKNFSSRDKELIISEIKEDFKTAYRGICELPASARMGVYMAYVYYYQLLKKLERTPPSEILHRRIRIPNYRKMSLVAYSVCSYKLLFR
jgi:phytoene/squalene synthetase